MVCRRIRGSRHNVTGRLWARRLVACSSRAPGVVAWAHQWAWRDSWLPSSRQVGSCLFSVSLRPPSQFYFIGLKAFIRTRPCGSPFPKLTATRNLTIATEADHQHYETRRESAFGDQHNPSLSLVTLTEAAVILLWHGHCMAWAVNPGRRYLCHVEEIESLQLTLSRLHLSSPLPPMSAIFVTSSLFTVISNVQLTPMPPCFLLVHQGHQQVYQLQLRKHPMCKTTHH